MHLLRWLLLPFSVLYGVVIRIRHWLFDHGWKASSRADLPTLVVGNLALGGTGKSPVTLYLADWLSKSMKIAILSRGYGRQTRGFRLLGDGDTAQTAGDEPIQIYRRKIPNTVVAVCEDRIEGVRRLKERFPDLDLVILDDALQHRKLIPDISILLSTCYDPFFADLLIPAGRLRDMRSRAAAADILLWTKCNGNIKPEFRSRASRYTSASQFTSGLKYGIEVEVSAIALEPSEKVVLLSGIANPLPMEEHIARKNKIVKHLKFKDHHDYTPEEIESIIEEANQLGARLVTTEKDWSRIFHMELPVKANHGFYYLPIELSFPEGEDEFRNIVLDKMKSAK